jgi:DNA-directed RNA polymerase subunit RPC12/RpoP
MDKKDYPKCPECGHRVYNLSIKDAWNCSKCKNKVKLIKRKGKTVMVNG